MEIKENPEPTTQELVDIFWKAYEERGKRFLFDAERAEQSELYLSGMEAVKTRLIQWSDVEWAKRYLSLKNIEEQPKVWRL